MSYSRKVELINTLGKKGKIFISTESELDTALNAHKLKCSPEQMHSVLAFATMYVGESQTMTSEAAVLGTPALKCNTFAGRLSIPNELEKEYGLCYSYLPEAFDKLLEKVDELLQMPDLKKEWQERRKIMLRNKIDVTAFWTWIVENYPSSVKTLKKEPNYAERFK